MLFCGKDLGFSVPGQGKELMENYKRKFTQGGRTFDHFKDHTLKLCEAAVPNGDWRQGFQGTENTLMTQKITANSHAVWKKRVET